MEQLLRKLEILGAAAKYDVSCSSSGISRKGSSNGIGSASACGICHTWTEDGRCLSLLKVLLSNACVYNCAYCVNACGNDVPRATFTPRELADLTIEFYRRNYIEGLFLSSGVLKNPDYTMELFVETLTILRQEYRFRGYIHVKGIPGCDPILVDRLGPLADRISVNIEFSSPKALQLLASNKNHKDILSPMTHIKNRRMELTGRMDRHAIPRKFFPAGQTTQVIVGATGERDFTLLKLSEGLYRGYGLKRVYYSAYIPAVSHKNLPAVTTAPPLLREHRLYQADWLLRFYGFTSDEILSKDSPNLDLEVDPKIQYALRHPELYPIEINTADYEQLLRVPGIGVTSAKRIIAARRYGSISEESLKKIGLVLKRARYFITVKGRFLGSYTPDNPFLRDILKDSNNFSQMTLYDSYSSPTSQSSDLIREDCLPVLLTGH